MNNITSIQAKKLELISTENWLSNPAIISELEKLNELEKEMEDDLKIQGVDLRKCNPGDRLLTGGGEIVTYVEYNTSNPYPHIIKWDDGSKGSRLDNGQCFMSEITGFDVIKILK